MSPNASTTKQSEPESDSNQIGRTSKPTAGLHVVATPIGNLGDITLRALEVLRVAAVVACEDTRVTKPLLRHFGITTPVVSYHEHNAEIVRPQLLARMIEGQVVALMSDAGTPLVSDPGYKLVRECVAAGISVFPLPGPSAVMAALVISGLPTDRFMFVGFLPSKALARQREISALAEIPATLVMFESTQRLPAMLADLAAGLGDRPAAVAREITKLFEEVRRDSLSVLAAHYAEAGPPKGEVVVVVGPPPEEDAVSDEVIDRQLAQALESMSLRDAVAAVATATGRPKRDVYARALALKS
ncbi:Ribosomal RNA small subunit methyltransferase I [Azospirillaceae bacterium]